MSDDKTIRIEKARSVLKASDQAIVRALETEVMGAEWCAWRERVREIARNGGEDVPPEPPRTKRLFDPHAEPAAVVMPDFLKAPEAEMNFHDDFIAREALDGEERADTVARLQLQFEKLTNYSYVRILEDAEQTRLSELTTNLRLGG